MSGSVGWRLVLYLLLAMLVKGAIHEEFVRVVGRELVLGINPYYFVGVNYWYGMNLGMSQLKTRIDQEIDELAAWNITNIRLIVSTQGPNSSSRRVIPSLEEAPKKWNEVVWKGLDYFLWKVNNTSAKVGPFLRSLPRSFGFLFSGLIQGHTRNYNELRLTSEIKMIMISFQD